MRLGLEPMLSVPDLQNPERKARIYKIRNGKYGLRRRSLPELTMLHCLRLHQWHTQLLVICEVPLFTDGKQRSIQLATCKAEVASFPGSPGLGMRLKLSMCWLAIGIDTPNKWFVTLVHCVHVHYAASTWVLYTSLRIKGCANYEISH